MTPTIVFSDVHLGTPYANKDDFDRFLDWLATRRISHLVILGDFLDFWRRANSQVIEENGAILKKLFDLDCRITYVAGNHDYSIWDIAKRHGKVIPLGGESFEVAKDLRLTVGKHSYYLTHGYELDCLATMEALPVETYEAFSAAMCRADDSMGGVASLLWDLFTVSGAGLSKIRSMQKTPHARRDIGDLYSIATSGAVHLLTGARPGDRFVFGHSHRPFITRDGRVANTGSWCTEAGCTVHNTFIEISPAGMQLRVFPGESG